MFKFSSIALLIFVATHSAQSFAEEEAGKTMIARGPVEALSSDEQSTRKLRRRSPIYGSDTVTTGAKGKAQLRMRDGGMIALKENSELFIEDYNFSDANGRGNVVMELVKGGLRSVTGSLKAESGDYKLKTPVGSIGIRGTHYEVEIVGNTIWVAVWDGAVDLDITSGQQAGSTLSLGQDEGYSYASIDADGEVTTYVEPPETFESGMTTEADDVDQAEEAEEETQEESTEQSQSSTVANQSVAVQITTEEDAEVQDAEDTAESDAQTEQLAENAADGQSQTDPETSAPPVPVENVADEDLNAVTEVNIEELLSTRVGKATYDGAVLEGIKSTAGGESDFQASMTINFSESRVEEGNISVMDNGGEWFATFDGYIDGEEFHLDVSYATHGDAEADGEVGAFFFNGLDSVFTNFLLHETLNPEINIEGSFIIK